MEGEAQWTLYIEVCMLKLCRIAALEPTLKTRQGHSTCRTTSVLSVERRNQLLLT